MKMRIGVLSPFYQNYNYGGKLQALAMIRVLEQQGYAAKQICYRQPSLRGRNGPSDRIVRLVHSSDYRRAVLQKLLAKCLPGTDENLEQRRGAFDRYDSFIPHTDRVYSDRDIVETTADFDVFLSGSDQVWNPNLFKRAYFLDFVPDGKYKMSYAASIAGTLNEEWQSYFRQQLAGFDAISLREKQGRQILEEIFPGREIACSLDPTLLLGADEWGKAASKPIVDEPYMFCYFLGYSAAQRSLARSVARVKGLTLITLPHLLGTAGRCYPCDISFGDRRLYDVQPDQFIALIQHADCILTDSFHATVLSLLFQKPFVAFDRTGATDHGSRVGELLEMCRMQTHYCGKAATVRSVCDLLEKQDVLRRDILDQHRDESMRYLINNLKKAEGML